MIQPNELRVGNLVNTAFGVKPVAGILGEKIYQDDSHYINFRGVSPIPLTPEWLERAGFVKGKHDWYTTIYHSGDMITEVNEIGINIESGRCSISHIGYIDAPFEQSDCVYCGKEIMYVHQLQNLVMALNGTELEFK